ncbi:protein kinase [Lysinibacillus sp. CNPSo 3705]|uniref:protein kinase n=1 Tax=Lysinibacillus sp. CNPSo 3705 TaxID=3028148 RepID=UPI00236419D9|nr:protein kinase [Lysinibacillus sp. CNPSo 3705]MDD1505676.1 protein kinase [Lysinibacillus sp. CNPSo 3705]
MQKQIIQNWNQYCIDENFVGLGSTRKVYRVLDYVIKVHLHPIGYKQSKNEIEIYTSMADKGLDRLFAQTYYVDEFISVQKYYKPLELKNNQSYEVKVEENRRLIPNLFDEVLEILDKNFDCFDLIDSSNYGLNNDDKLVFIDYGMTKKLYEKEWIPLAEEGILPQIHFDFCIICGLEKELRMYGDYDKDKRCYECGKE